MFLNAGYILYIYYFQEFYRLPRIRNMSNVTLLQDGKVICALNNNIATITLNRPEVRNALDQEMILTLLQLIKNLQNNDDIKLLVITGEGENFCSGADIEWMRKSINYSREENFHDALNLAKLLYLLYYFSKPTLCMVQGAAFGGAMGLIACCDIVIADENAKFCFPEVKLGLIPAIVGPYVIRAIGGKAARYYMLTAEPFSAVKAKELGLINEIVSASQLSSTLEQYLGKLNKNGPKALVHTKYLINALIEEQSTGLSLAEHTAAMIADIRISDEAQEGLRAFLEKRPPKWQG